MTHVQDKKDALATLVEIEQQNLEESLNALKETATREVEEIRHRVQHIAEKLDVRTTIVEHRYKVLAGAFALGLAFGLRHMLDD